jgi:serine/threonine-protein kinase
LAALAADLRDRYVLERELGRGGMAIVFLAHDLKHGRPVAFKVLHSELAASPGVERFQREIRLAARLQHPHILSVYDSGESAGRFWFTMPYVDGESLRDRLLREPQLPLADALRVAREAAEALGYAHGQGVIHRDVKPENIMLTRDGNTLVADFGIARAVGAESGARLTASGMSIGTPAYMSPEQTDEAEADARSDQYSLAAVLYEMLAGEPPFTGRSLHAIVAKRISEPTPSVRARRPAVPAGMDAAIRKAMAPEPANRFPSVAEFAEALGDGQIGRWADGQRSLRVVARLVAGLAAVAIVGALSWRALRLPLGPAAHQPIPVVAVLPFENLGDSADAYFADGVADEIRAKLAQVAGLEVIARGSSIEYRRTTRRPTAIARELGADYLLSGTVRWEKAAGGSRVRVMPELVDARSGETARTRWVQRFDASLTDVFQVQADIATKVASALNVALGDSARHELAAKPTANLAAYDAYLKGEAASQGMGVGDPASLRRAIGFYEQAVALDSAFVLAWAQLARARAFLYTNSTPTPELAAEAREAAERAQALGPDRPEGPLALGTYYWAVAVDNRRALAAYEAGLKLAPNNADLLGTAGVAEQRQGHWDAALQHLAKAAALDPRSANTARRTGFTLLYLRRYFEAQTAMNRALALAPTNLAIIEQRAVVALAQGDLAGARAVVRAGLAAVEPAALLAHFGNYQDLYWVLDDAQQQQLLTLPPSAWDNDQATWAIIRAETYQLRGNPGQTRVYADAAQLAYEKQLRATPDDGQRHVLRGLALAYLGRKAEAIAEGERGVALWPISRDAFVGPYLQHQLVRIYVLVGEPEKALDQLEPLLTIPYYLSPGWLRIDPTFAPLRGNPRFERLVAGT